MAVALRDYFGCPYKIHWGIGQECTTQCSRPAHTGKVTMTSLPDGRFFSETEGDPDHSGPGLMEGQVITWVAGDRREYTGDWPGPCPKLPSSRPCTLHDGHYGRCAP